MPPSGAQLLDEALSPERVFLTQARHKEELLHQLVDQMPISGEIQDIEALRAAIFLRESLMSTGIGLGVGVPHARISSVRHMVVAVAKNERPLIDYESIDGQPVQLVFMVAGRPDHQSNYVRMLAVLSRMVKDPETHASLLAASDTDSLFKAIRNAL